MRKLALLSFVLSVFTLIALKPVEEKLISKDTHISFFSHTSVEDITANNYKVVSTLETTTGSIVFSIPMQSFEFENATMQEHYNSSKFLNTKKFPKAKFIGTIDNLSEVNFNSNGEYQITVSGDLDIKGETKSIKEKATITVADGKVTLTTKVNITLADFGVVFTKGKPSKNIAKDIEITVKAIYSSN